MPQETQSSLSQLVLVTKKPFTRRWFLKGVAAAGALATLPFLRSVGKGTDVVPFFDASQDAQQVAEALDYKPLETVVLDVETGDIVDSGPEVGQASSWHEATIRQMLFEKGYGLYMFKGYDNGTWTLAYRYLAASSRSSLNYLSAYSFPALVDGVEKLRSMTVLTPQEIEKAHRAKFGDKLYDDLYVRPNLTALMYGNIQKSVGFTGARESVLVGWGTVEEQANFVGLPGVAKVSSAAHNRDFTSFVEGSSPGNTRSPEFTTYWDEVEKADRERWAEIRATQERLRAQGSAVRPFAEPLRTQ